MAEGTVIAENTVGELLQDSVSRTLAIEMLDGVWKAGESLTLEALQSRFGISRTVAREVAKTLESMNAVLVNVASDLSHAHSANGRRSTIR